MPLSQVRIKDVCVGIVEYNIKSDGQVKLNRGGSESSKGAYSDFQKCWHVLDLSSV